MKTKTTIGILAILAIVMGVLLIVLGSRQGGWFGKPTSTPTPTPTTTPTMTETPVISLTPTVTAFLAGDLGWGKVAGTVTDGGTGQPVSGALVSCQQVSYVPRLLCDGKTVTGPDGTFTFDPVFFHDTDTIILEVQAPGYAPQTIRSSFFTLPGMNVDFVLAQPTPTPTVTPTLTTTPIVMCTPPPCAIGTSEAYTCPSGNCPGGCGTSCATYTSTP